MPDLEITLPDRVDTEIDRLVEQGEFINRDQAVEELLSMGMSVYDTAETDEVDDEWMTQDLDDQQDPALQDDFESDDRRF